MDIGTTVWVRHISAPKPHSNTNVIHSPAIPRSLPKSSSSSASRSSSKDGDGISDRSGSGEIDHRNFASNTTIWLAAEITSKVSLFCCILTQAYVPIQKVDQTGTVSLVAQVVEPYVGICTKKEHSFK